MSVDDVTEIKRVVTCYVEGYLNADVSALKAVFAKGAVMNGYIGERRIEGSPDVFIENVGKSAPIASLGGNPTFDIGEVEIRGNAAAVTLQEHDFGGRNFTDFMHLIKHDGVWKIISKTFSTF